MVSLRHPTRTPQTNAPIHPTHPHTHAHTPARQSRLSEEYERSAEYLDASSRRPLLGVVEAQLVGRHVGALLDRGLAPLLDGHRVSDLARLHALCGRVGATEALRAALKAYIRATGLAIVKDEEKVGGGGGRGGEHQLVGAVAGVGGGDGSGSGSGGLMASLVEAPSPSACVGELCKGGGLWGPGHLFSSCTKRNVQCTKHTCTAPLPW